MRGLDTPRARAALVLAVAAAAAWTLRTFPPWLYAIYPRCPIRVLTGWRCPGCGTTHALAAMLAGQWAEAWHYNAMATIVYPVLAALALLPLYSALRWNRWWSELRLLGAVCFANSAGETTGHNR